MSSKAKIEKLTPRICQDIIDRADPNRTISESAVKAYARAMTNGMWRLNGETIKFGVDGRLIDGHHRVRACVAAGVPFEAWVIRGVEDPMAYATIDRGIIKSHAHIAQMHGEQNTVALAAGMQSWNSWRNKRPTSIGRAATADKLSPEELINVLGTRPAFRAAAALGVSCQKILAPSLATFLYYWFAHNSTEKADQFFESLKTGADLKESSPIYILRERLLAHRASAAKVPPHHVAALVVLAWNSFVSGRPIKVLRWQPDTAFPQAIGCPLPEDEQDA